MKINNFRGELTDISAKKEPLPAGVAHKEEVVAWALSTVRDTAYSEGTHLHSVPLYSLPIMIDNDRKYPWNAARLDFYLEVCLLSSDLVFISRYILFGII